jgi:hypothetical protein
MIKIHKLDGYKFLRDPSDIMQGWKRRNLTYLCLEMTDFQEDMKAFKFLEEFHDFHYELIANELLKFVNNTSGKLPKVHILYKEETLEDGLMEKAFSITKNEPKGILKYIKEEIRLYNEAEESSFYGNIKVIEKENRSPITEIKTKIPKNLPREVLNDYLNNTDYYDFIKKNKDDIRYKDGVLYINSESLTREFTTFGKDFNGVQEAKLVPKYMNHNKYLNDFSFKYYDSIQWKKNENLGYVRLPEIARPEIPSSDKLILIYEWLEINIDSN